MGSLALPIWFRALGYFLLLFTPGAWVTFGLALERIPFWAKLFTAAMLSPLIACGEFFALRIVGIPFGTAAIVLVLLNLPAIYLIWRRRPGINLRSRGEWLVGAGVVLIPVACVISILMYTDVRVFSPHGWYHADAAYMFARGDLVLEDPTLAGMRLPYPVWSPLAYQAVLSYLVNSPPVTSYAWCDVVCLMAVYAFAAGIAKLMGGGKVAQLGSGLLLLFGTSPVGNLMRLAPRSLLYTFDQRYAADWITKFQLSGPMALALGMLMALIYLLVRFDRMTKEYLFVIWLLLAGIGLFYPLLLPPAACMIGARALASLADGRDRLRVILYREWVAWAALILLAGLLTYGEIRFITSDRLVSGSLASLSAVRNAGSKTLAAVMATVFFLAGVAVTFRQCWKSRPAATAMLLIGGLANYVLYAAIHIPFYDNEYKFVFAVTMCLAVFPAIAAERIWQEWGHAKAIPVLAVMAVLLVGPYAYSVYATWPAPWVSLFRTVYARSPLLDTKGFYLKLDPSEAWSGICDAVRTMTPSNSIVVLNNSALYYPELTARSLYVAAENRDYRGVNLFADDLDADLRGFGKQILVERRAILAELFGASDDNRRERALNVILSLKRPVGIVAEPQHAELLEWLKHRKGAKPVFAQNGLSLWLFDGSTGVPAGTSKIERSLFAQWLEL